MTYMRVAINETTIFDGDLYEWRATPPDFFKDLIRPDVKPEPWLKAIMVVMADATMTGQSLSIDTVSGEDGWFMEVTKL